MLSKKRIARVVVPYRRESIAHDRLVLSNTIVAIVFVICSTLCGVVMAQSSAQATTEQTVTKKQTKTMTKVIMTVDGKKITATSEDNATAKDFLSLLPLTLTLQDYNKTEKVSDLPKRLSTEGAPQGLDPQVGDITLYSPWGNLAIFYRDFGYARGLVKLGRIDSGIEHLKRHGSFDVTFKRAGE